MKDMQDKYDKLSDKNAEILAENINQMNVSQSLREKIEQKHIEMLELRDKIMNSEKDFKMYVIP